MERPEIMDMLISDNMEAASRREELKQRKEEQKQRKEEEKQKKEAEKQKKEAVYIEGKGFHEPDPAA